ncbi:MAG TPA: antibiotic resistance protein MarC [Cyanobacteria bacterium UBA9579]|nr:antibiotic resistance protein MarC [Cyanobacteria bacterium UBA9579]
MNSLLVIFLALFFTIDVIGVTPIFVSLTSNVNNEYRRKMAINGVFIATLILLLFAISGTSILNILGIELAAFRIAGGILLLLLSIDMVLAKPISVIRTETKEEHEEALYKHDISVFPLAIPLLSGPATITMLILFMRQAQGNIVQQLVVLSALTANMFICWIVLNFSSEISKFLGTTGINVLNRIFGVLLTALACQFFIDGISEAFLKR